MRQVLKRTLPQSILQLLGATERYVKKQRTGVGWRIVTTFHTFDPSNNLLVCSDPRGGSTWLAEAVAQIPQTVLLVEPLHLGYPSRFKALNFSWYQYISEHADWGEARQAFDMLFRGKISYIKFHGSPMGFTQADRMVIKFCYAKALLPWLVNNFTFNHAPINFVRHPGSVASSMIRFERLGWSHYFLPSMLQSDNPYNEFYTRHADFLATITTKEEELMAIWCMTNQVVLQHAHNNEAWITVFYEDLLVQPEAEIRRIFQTWGLPVPQSIWDQLQKPSATARDTTTSPQERDVQLRKWQTYFSPEQKARMQEILDYFGVDIYHMDDVMPRKV